jgi:hypothetical protein
MKRIALLLAVSALAMISSGCPGTGQDKYFEEAKRGNAVTALGTASNAEANSAPTRLSAQANGGSNLPASMPYLASNAPAVSQNLNAAPFLTTAGAPMSNLFVSPQQLGLTSRAEGNMSGPSDQPAAGIGRGMTPVVPGREGGKVPSRR